MNLVDQAYPSSGLNVEGPNEATVQFFASTEARVYAEIGVYKGHTAARIAEQLDGQGEVHLFDYEDRLAEAGPRVRETGHPSVIEHPNSRLIMDSYNWSLMRLLAEHGEPIFDYAFIDGAHTWALDGLAFLLVDRLLKPGGHVDFDDYSWTLARSPSMKPEVFPEVRRLYSQEQIDEPQVALVVDLLVRRDPRYQEILENKAFRKREA
jgi:predicted O-methyltransferase YrrM